MTLKIFTLILTIITSIGYPLTSYSKQNEEKNPLVSKNFIASNGIIYALFGYKSNTETTNLEPKLFRVFKYERTGWTQVGNDLIPDKGSHVSGFSIDENNFYISFTKQDDKEPSNNLLYTLTQDKWIPLDTASAPINSIQALVVAPDSSVYIVAKRNGQKYFGDNFIRIRNSKLDILSNDFALGSGGKITKFGSTIYATGLFRVGLKEINTVAKFDGKDWFSLGKGISYESPNPGRTDWTDGIFSEIAIINENDIYIGGNFTNSGKNKVYAIARWDGKNWSNLKYIGLPSPVNINSSCNSLAVLKKGTLFTILTQCSSSGKCLPYFLQCIDGTCTSLNTTKDMHIQFAEKNLLAVDDALFYIGETSLIQWDGSAWQPTDMEYPTF